MTPSISFRPRNDNAIKLFLDLQVYIPEDLAEIMLAEKPPPLDWSLSLPCVFDPPREALLDIILNCCAVLEGYPPLIYRVFDFIELASLSFLKLSEGSTDTRVASETILNRVTSLFRENASACYLKL